MVSGVYGLKKYVKQKLTNFQQNSYRQLQL